MLVMAERLGLETDLFLLTLAEGVRAPYPPRRQRPLSPRMHPTPASPSLPPVPDRYLQRVVQFLRQAQTAGTLQKDMAPEQVAEWMTALWWYRLCRRGPRHDAGAAGPVGAARAARAASPAGAAGVAGGASTDAFAADLDHLLRGISAAPLQHSPRAAARPATQPVE